MPVKIAIEQEVRTITIKQVFEALKKNGFEHIREGWFSYNAANKAVGACVLGQAALNLGVPVSDEEDLKSNLTDALNRFDITDAQWEQADKAGVPLDGLELGAAIIGWNDARVQDEHGMWSSFVLKSYEDVVKKAYGLMKPHFNETIELPHYEY